MTVFNIRIHVDAINIKMAPVERRGALDSAERERGGGRLWWKYKVSMLPY